MILYQPFDRITGVRKIPRGGVNAYLPSSGLSHGVRPLSKSTPIESDVRVITYRLDLTYLTVTCHMYSLSLSSGRRRRRRKCEACLPPGTVTCDSLLPGSTWMSRDHHFFLFCPVSQLGRRGVHRGPPPSPTHTRHPHTNTQIQRAVWSEVCAAAVAVCVGVCWRVAACVQPVQPVQRCVVGGWTVPTSGRCCTRNGQQLAVVVRLLLLRLLLVGWCFSTAVPGCRNNHAAKREPA